MKDTKSCSGNILYVFDDGDVNGSDDKGEYEDSKVNELI